MKKHKGLVISLIAGLVLVSLMCIVSIAYNFLGGFYYCRVLEYNTILGEKQTIEVSGEGAFISACNFSGSIVINTNIKQEVYVKTTAISEPLNLRAKFGIHNINMQEGLMFGFSNWVQASDGYLYFNQAVNPNETVGLCNTVTANVQSQLKSSENYIMYFVVEASTSPYEYEAV